MPTNTNRDCETAADTETEMQREERHGAEQGKKSKSVHSWRSEASNSEDESRPGASESHNRFNRFSFRHSDHVSDPSFGPGL